MLKLVCFVDVEMHLPLRSLKIRLNLIYVNGALEN